MADGLAIQPQLRWYRGGFGDVDDLALRAGCERRDVQRVIANQPAKCAADGLQISVEAGGEEHSQLRIVQPLERRHWPVFDCPSEVLRRARIEWHHEEVLRRRA